ncbi:hypothetical protein SAMN05444320_11375 [Streptoalloteichus hindustanus]|uniref:Uncharacterized protein n=1 Tax=Streptoalloteichus hindustanus TaxID=2017 RepID=A0A1M5MCR8_STRHI|nr:hypothetical protein SAMN05444320_11375 [Streptoalloteichus hindustanus]
MLGTSIRTRLSRQRSTPTRPLRTRARARSCTANTIAGLLYTIASPAVAFGCVAVCMALALAALAWAAKTTPSAFYAIRLLSKLLRRQSGRSSEV